MGSVAVLQVGPAVLALVAFAAFAWAFRSHFVATRTPRGTWGLSVLALVTLAAGLWGIAGRDRLAWATLLGIAGMGAALLLFGAAVRATRGRGLGLAFDLEAPAGLVATGPYRVLRHPFYTAYGIYWLSLWACAQTWLTGLLVAALLAVYVAAARHEEAAFARSALADDYRAYRARTRLIRTKSQG